MDEIEKQICELYVECAFGLKKISREIGLSPATIKRVLEKHSLYEGLEKYDVTGEPWPTPNDLTTWHVGSGAKVIPATQIQKGGYLSAWDIQTRYDTQGWGVTLVGPTAELSCPLSNVKYKGRSLVFTLAIKLPPGSVPSGVLMGLSDISGATASTVWPVAGTTPAYFRVARVVTHDPVAFIRGADAGPTNLHVVEITIAEKKQ